MNENLPIQVTEFVFRRLADPLRIFSKELPPSVWLVVLTFVLLLAFVFVGWMYLRDSRSIGILWAMVLGLSRAMVYGLLAFAFLLPAEQTWEQSTSRSKVVIAFDASSSMITTIDDIPSESVPLNKLPTRQEKVIKFLGDSTIDFLGALEKTNPVFAYRFGRSLDENFLQFQEGTCLTKEDREKLKEALKDNLTFKTEMLGAEAWQAWLQPGKLIPAKEGAAESELNRLQTMITAGRNKVEAGDFNATNVVDSVVGILQREMNQMTQGIVVFSDGRSTEGTLQALKDLEERATAARIPIFVVAVGEDRPKVKTEIVDLRVPGRVQPDDRFRVAVEVVGEGLAEKEFQAFLDITNVRKNQTGKEELLDVAIEEAGSKGSKDKLKINLGNKITLVAPVATYDKGNPPRAEVEFQVDAQALAKAAGREADLTGKKWVLAETPDSEIRFVARVPRDKSEIALDKEHKRGPVEMRVMDKPLRVLLVASGPMRDYQFVRTLFVRETERKRAELAILLQNPPGKTERRPGVVQDIPPEKLLTRFPDLFDSATVDPNEKIYDLASYDVIVAFDPDWKQVNDLSMNLLRTWVDKGGGLIVIAGPLHTLELARPGAEKEKLKPILDLYPVVLKDIRIEEMDRKPDSPKPLRFDGATPEMEFLRLDEDDQLPFLKDWEQFFNVDAKDGQPKRGFYNFYPIEQAKTGSIVVARFDDPLVKGKDGKEQPFIVISDPASGKRVVWIGSGEVWRIRQYREQYFERFWMKLARYASAAATGKENRRISPYLGGPYLANRFIEFEARIDDKGGKPLGSAGRPPRVLINPPAGVAQSEIPKEILMTPRP
ncbi:MAG: vWA domain-containing protein, partial [Planctomycetota bacterium]